MIAKFPNNGPSYSDRAFITDTEKMIVFETTIRQTLIKATLVIETRINLEVEYLR